jgi:catechol 1,2-dioxygenase
MSNISRRAFLSRGGQGLAVVGASGLILAAAALPTVASGTLGDYGTVLRQEQQQRVAVARQTVDRDRQPRNFTPTEDNIEGPYYRANAPFRAKITPPLEPGTVLVISGRVWGSETRRPLANAVLDIWQANSAGRYDNDDPKNQPARNLFVNRARLITDDSGYYEFETVHPGPYQIGPNAWRPSHIHYLVRATGHRQLITQLYFRGDRHIKGDQFVRESLIIDLRDQKSAGGQAYRTGVFDVVLAPARREGNKR